MSLNSTINDCQKVLDFLLKDNNVFVDSHHNLKFEDRSIIGLFKSLIENAKAFVVLKENQLENPESIIVRTIIEQYTYFRYIFKINNRNSIIKRAEVLSWYQRREQVKKDKESVDKQIEEGLKKENEKKELEEEYKKIDKEYKSLFQYSKYKKLINKYVYRHWYNLEKNKNNYYHSLKDLMEDLKIDPYIYVLYAKLSDSTHGIADLKNIALKDLDFLNDENKNPNIIIINHINDEAISRLIISILSGVFSLIFSYYRQLNNIALFKIMKIKMNSNNDIEINYLRNLLKNNFN